VLTPPIPRWGPSVARAWAPARRHPSSHTDQIGEETKQEIVGGCPALMAYGLGKAEKKINHYGREGTDRVTGTCVGAIKERG